MAKNFCTGCGAELAEGERFCTACGQKAPAAASVPAYSVATPPSPPVQHQQPMSYGQQNMPPSPPVYGGGKQTGRPPNMAQGGFGGAAPTGKYAPITTLGWLGIMLLMLIPLVNIILLIVWACGGCEKVTKRSFARASLIGMAISVVLSVVFGFVAKAAIEKYSAALQEAVLGSVASEMGIDSSAMDALEGLDLGNMDLGDVGGAETDAETGLKEAQALLDMLK